MKLTLLSILAYSSFACAFAVHAEPPELKQHRDAKSKQDLKQVLDRQDGNLEWRMKHFDKNHDGTLDRKELNQNAPFVAPSPQGRGLG